VISAGFKAALLFTVALPGIGCASALITQGNFTEFCVVSFITGTTFYYGVKLAIQATIWEMVESVEKIDEDEDEDTWKPA